MNANLLGALILLIRKCLAFSRFKLVTGLMLMVLNSFISGVGILLIVPLLASIGVYMGQGAPTNSISSRINDLASYFGLELNLSTILIIYLLLIVGFAAFSFVSSIILVSLRLSFVIYLRNEIARLLFFTQWRYLNSQYMADFMRLLTGQISTVGSSLNLLLTLAASIILVLVYLSFSMFLSAKLTLVALLCGVTLTVFLWPVNKRIYASGELGLNASKSMHRSIFENLSSLRIIKSYASEERYLQYMQGANKAVEDQQVRIATFTALTRFVNMVGAAVIFALLFYVSIEWLALPTENLLVVLFIFSRLMPQISSMQSTLQSLIHKAPSYIDLLEQSNSLTQWSERKNDRLELPRFAKELQFKQLRYQYMGSQKNVFENLDASIKCKQTVAIVGPSGIGKSTLADLISGLIAPSSGTILVDGVAITDENRLAWRKQVAYVTQEVFLFHGTIRENLSWVCDTSEYPNQVVPEAELLRVLNLAAAEQFVKKLPQGLDTMVGDRGVKLSGGERQRLALARALLSKPQVLILDEATSALDRENELQIRDALVNLEGTLTIFIIAHNTATIEHVAQRIELGLN